MQRIYLMLGFRRFKNATITISDIELAHQVRKEQFATACISPSGSRASVKEFILIFDALNKETALIRHQ
jgi:hypothetical protein